MASALQQYFEGKIDFEGQKLVEQITHYALSVLGVVAFFAGLATQSLSVTWGIFGAGVLVLLVAVVPPWPMFNRHPVKWLPAKETKEKKS
ncbi:microsomal signal peptidase subunit [Gloeopeniophorella convolvens]|nr:microsomal signal peptidase subunit [Gloeopeniophorella convolvens]